MMCAHKQTVLIVVLRCWNSICMWASQPGGLWVTIARLPTHYCNLHIPEIETWATALLRYVHIRVQASWERVKCFQSWVVASLVVNDSVCGCIPWFWFSCLFAAYVLREWRAAGVQTSCMWHGVLIVHGAVCVCVCVCTRMCVGVLVCVHKHS
jgi:hypothetical protein